MKVKQRKIHLKLNPGRPYESTIVFTQYDNRDYGYHGDREPEHGRFFIKLPVVLAGALGQEEVRAKTQVEVERAFDEAIAKFKNMKTETHEIIAYRFSVAPDPNPDKHYGTSSGYEVRVWAGAYVETVAIAGDDRRRYSYERIEDSPIQFPDKHYRIGSHDGQREDKQVPLTKENEVFFVWIADRMTALIDALASLREPAHLLEAINSGRLLPLGSQEPK